MNNLIKTERFYSTWIVIYSYLYIFNLTLYNPVLLLSIAYAFTLMISVYIVYRSNSIYNAIPNLLFNTICKLLPIIMIWNDKIDSSDILFSLMFTIIYIGYMHIINDNIICLYKDYVLFFIDQKQGRKTEIQYYFEQISNHLITYNPKRKNGFSFQNVNDLYMISK
jgi:hypothetical protein